MSVQSISSNATAATTPLASTGIAKSTATATTTPTSATDTVTISATAQQFASVLRELSSKLNAFEHQVTWQADNKAAITGPTDTIPATSNSSSGSATTAATSNSSSGSTTTASTSSTAAQTITDGFASLQSKYESQLTGLTADQQSRLDAANQKLTTEQARFQTFITDRTGPDYNAATRGLTDKINAFEHQVTWQIDHGASVTAPETASSTTTAATTTTASTTVPTTTNAASSNASTGSTTASTASNRASINTSSGSVATDASASINTSTGTPSTTASPAATSTVEIAKPTTAQTIADGFASLEAVATRQLGSLSTQLTTEFQQLQQKLATEQTRFTSFVAQRSAYQAAQTTTGKTQDVAA